MLEMEIQEVWKMEEMSPGNNTENNTEKSVPVHGQIMCVRQDNDPQRCSGPNFQNLRICHLTQQKGL